ncbi:MAG: Non-canonical purine NTP pyrophosphatase [Deltaproteobacteria bacterium ADurb.Bin510]|nr:MAG: Non-canonical purine NTP pyrophosphatase [Deltaproteobacteria bacterium ADurb.Bin510]
MKLLAATNNAGKLAEIRSILADHGFEVISPAEAGLKLEVEEDGATFEANALKKAQAWRDLSGLAALADDSGLCVDALGGAPGVRTARYAGENASDEANYSLLLERLAGASDRAARFVCVIALCLPDGRSFVAQGECPGLITTAPRGAAGFGYDPVFLDEATGLTFAELDSVTKNARSHRGRALQDLVAKLKTAGF